MNSPKTLLPELVIAVAMAALVAAWPGLHDLAALGRFAASWVILVHWHFGVSFVLRHLGPPRRLWQTLGESLALLCLLAMTQALQAPAAWFLLNTAAYLVALLRYLGQQPRGLSPGLSLYVRWKAWVEVVAVALNLGGAALAWAWPGSQGWLAWAALGLNLAAAYGLSELLRLYDISQILDLQPVAQS